MWKFPKTKYYTYLHWIGAFCERAKNQYNFIFINTISIVRKHHSWKIKRKY